MCEELHFYKHIGGSIEHVECLHYTVHSTGVVPLIISVNYVMNIHLSHIILVLVGIWYTLHYHRHFFCLLVFITHTHTHIHTHTHTHTHIHTHTTTHITRFTLTHTLVCHWCSSLVHCSVFNIMALFCHLLNLILFICYNCIPASFYHSDTLLAYWWKLNWLTVKRYFL